MKKTILCIILAAVLFISAAACKRDSGALSETTAPTAESTTEAAGFDYPSLSQAEKALAFRYFYIGKWEQVCYNVNSLNVVYGSGSKLKDDVSPEKQYYISVDGKSKVLWSDKLAEITVTEINEKMALFDAAAADDNFEMDDKSIQQIEQTVDFAKQSADSKGVTFEKYLTDTYGYGFTEEMFRKLITIEMTSYAYTSKLNDRFMEQRSKEIISYEEYSEVAAEDCEEYTDKIVSEYSHNFYPTDAACSQGKKDALTAINASLEK